MPVSYTVYIFIFNLLLEGELVARMLILQYIQLGENVTDISMPSRSSLTIQI